MPRPSRATHETHACEADTLDGLEPFAADEIRRLSGRVADAAHGVITFEYTGDLTRLAGLRTVLSAYLLRRFDVPRPKALLGDQHLRALLAQIDAAMAVAPRTAWRTFMLGAAGADSPVMQRIKEVIAQHTGLAEVQEEGDLLVRLRPSAPHPQPLSQRERGASWDTLVRLGPKPLATRDWRACVVEGALQATVAHVMAALTKPKLTDVYLNLCCGSGTLIIERALIGKASRLIGCDTDVSALACATRNVKASGKHIELHTWDATSLPLPDASIDAITADVPFGLRVGSHTANETLYPALLREAARVAKPGARFVVISAEVKLLQRAIAAVPEWALSQTLRVNLGGLKPEIKVLERR